MFKTALILRMLVWAIIFGYAGLAFGGKGSSSITVSDEQIYFSIAGVLLGAIIGFATYLISKKKSGSSEI